MVPETRHTDRSELQRDQVEIGVKAIDPCGIYLTKVEISETKRPKKLFDEEENLENLLAFVAHELVLLAVRPQMHVERIGMGEHLPADHVNILPPKMGA